MVEQHTADGRADDGRHDGGHAGNAHHLGHLVGFPTRDALLGAVVRDGFDALRDLADGLLAEPSPRTALATWIWRFSVNSGACRGLSGSVLTGLHDQDSELHASSEAMHQAATRLLARAQEAGEIREGVTATDLITMAAATGWVAQITGEDQSRRMLAVLMDGLTPSSDGNRSPSGRHLV